MSSPLPATLIHYQLALTVILVLVGMNLIANLHMLGRAAPSEEPSPEQRCTPVPEPVSVLVPARNEARNIRLCLESLLAQDWPLMEVLVLNDGSSDATGAIVAQLAQEDPRLHLILGQVLPQGWMGKNYACHQLAQVARGEWLLFTDADTVHRPGSLAWAITAARRNGSDLLTLIPYTVTQTIGERLILPVIPFGLLGCYPLALGARLRVPSLAMALGPYMLFRRQAYHRVGGHQAVREEIAEDVALARQIRRAGGRVTLLDGSDQLEVHFYRGFRESWHGLAKSAFAALQYRLLPSLLMVGFYGFLFLWPVMLLLWGLWQGRMGEPALRLALFQVFLNSGLWYAVAVRFRLPRSTAFYYPLTILVTILIMLDSIRRATFSGIGWKERIYHVRRGSLRH